MQCSWFLKAFLVVVHESPQCNCGNCACWALARGFWQVVGRRVGGAAGVASS